VDVLWKDVFVKGRFVEGCFVEGCFVGRTFCNEARFVEGRFVLAPYPLYLTFKKTWLLSRTMICIEPTSDAVTIMPKRKQEA
jgi:hypothetical protein